MCQHVLGERYNQLIYCRILHYIKIFQHYLCLGKVWVSVAALSVLTGWKLHKFGQLNRGDSRVYMICHSCHKTAILIVLGEPMLQAKQTCSLKWSLLVLLFTRAFSFALQYNETRSYELSTTSLPECTCKLMATRLKLVFN